MISRVWEMLRTKFVRDAATLQVATTISQGFQVVTTAALALLLGAEGQGLSVSAIALQALVPAPLPQTGTSIDSAASAVFGAL